MTEVSKNGRRRIRRGRAKPTLLRLLLFIIALLATRQACAQQPTAVDLTLVLAIDCSWSITNDEFDLQMQATAAAFRHPAVIRAITGGTHGRIAVTVLQWSDPQQQTLSLPWLVIEDVASAHAAANRIATIPRQVHGGATSISAVLQFATAHILKSPFSALRQVIDVSGDGRNNSGGPPEHSRDLAVRLGLTINGLTILSKEHAVLDEYFRRRVIGGPGHFVEIANEHRAYPEAILRKLLREVSYTN
ncbi:MAG: DUF1194 domain-containing protein [Hyphomicrobiaceae bacterium]